MNKSLLTILLVAFAAPSFGQYGSGDIQMKNSFFGSRFYRDGKAVSMNEVQQALALNEEASPVFRKARSNYNVAQTFGYIGGFMIGWPLGTALAGGDPQWGLAAGGAGVLLIAIPFSSAFRENARNALEIYNRKPVLGRRNPLSVEIVPWGAGGKVVMRL